MITSSYDKTLRLWDLETGVVLKKMEGHGSAVWALAISRDGKIIASGDTNGDVIACHGETGESITQPIEAHSRVITSVDFSPDGMVLATIGSWDSTVKFWSTKTWQMQGDPIECGSDVYCVRYSPSGELLAIGAFSNIQIYNTGTREEVASLTGHKSWNTSIAWTPDGTRLLSGSGNYILEWDTSTWQQAGDPWKGHTNTINAIAIHPAGTLVASASYDNHVRLWRLSDQRAVAIFQYLHPSVPRCLAFSMDGKHILSGDEDNKILEWAVPSDVNSKILDITTARNACLTGDLSIAEELLTQEIHTNANDFTSYANRSFVMARKHNLDHALEDAIKSINIKPSLTGFISKGIALCGKGHVQEAREAFNDASTFTDEDSETNQFLLLIKAIALFNADQHEEAMLLIKDRAAACPNVDPLARCVVETYLRVQLGIKAFDGAHHDEAADHFTAAVNSGAFSSKFMPQIYEDLTVLFGWDLESLLLTTHQQRCQAFLSAGKPDKALNAHKSMMDAIDDIVKASCLDWSNEFKQKCSTLAADNDRILGAEIPGQDHDGYDAEPNFYEMQQISRPRLQQRAGRLKRLKLAMTKRPQSVPAPAPAPPATSPPVATTTTFKTRIRRLFTLPLHHATPPVVDVPYAQGRQRNAAAGAPGSEHSLIRDEDAPPQDPNTQQQHQPVAVQVDTGQHGKKYAQGRQRNAAAGAPGSEHSLIRDEDALPQDPNTQQQHQPVAGQVDTGQHGGSLSCCCC